MNLQTNKLSTVWVLTLEVSTPVTKYQQQGNSNNNRKKVMQVLVGALALAAFSVTPIQALASWLQVYIGTTKSGGSVKISPIPDDVYDLTEAVKVEVEPELNHCDAANLEVFAVGTSVPIPDGTEPLDPWDPIPTFTTSKKPLIVVAPLRLRQQEYKPEKEFDLEHLKSIKVDGSVDCSRGFNFIGRIAFTSQVKESLQWLKVKGPTDVKGARALVYSSVSGSGKTVSMLHLKTSLRESLPDMRVIVACLGFNGHLYLNTEEIDFISLCHDEINGAMRVLARRLAAATIISHENPQEVYKLPHYKEVYDKYQIPSVAKSMSLILECTKATPENPIYIVAGVDEFQILNRVAIAEGSSAIGLGRLFLRFLRRWQYQWYTKGIRLLPLGTGIALDWLTEPTEGVNMPLDDDDDDATLISKQDFHKLVTDVVDGLSDEQFTSQCSDGTSKATAIDLVAAAFWPRVRLLQWWREGETVPLRQHAPDVNSEKWVKWLCYWLRGDVFSCISDQDDVPGKGDEEGSIRCLFQLNAEASHFSVIPDGYGSLHVIDILSQQLPVPYLYDDLMVIKSLQPKEFILRDAYAFENFGFCAVGTSIHVGLHALNRKRITASSASPTQKKRLGLAMWFQDEQAVTHKKEQLCVPRILGPFGRFGNFGEYYPFKNGNQTTFDDAVVKSLQEGVKKRCGPVYIRCGRGTCCDYLYFYVRVMHSNKAELICNICDAKHTNNVEEEGSANSITTNDQVGLFRAVENVHCAVKNANLVLGNVRLLFVTSRDELVEPNAESPALKRLTAARQAAHKVFPEVQLELLNKASFEFGPFSDILFARRKKKSMNATPSV